MGFIKYLLYAMRKEGLYFWAIIFAVLIVVSMKFALLIIIPIVVLFRAYQNFLTTGIANESGMFARFVIPLSVILSPVGLLLFLKYLEKKDKITFSPEFLILLTLMYALYRVFPEFFTHRGRLRFKRGIAMEDYYYEKRQEAKYRK